MPISEFMLALISGGFAGFAVDISLFPLDTFKTRAQSKEGFFKSGGFKGAFKGLGPAAVGSFPGAAMFFATYETTKTHIALENQTLTHLTAASIGEVIACLIRVPTENLKQNLQTNRFDNLKQAFQILQTRGGFYNGYVSTLMREIPFSCIQFPIWEFGKDWVKDHSSNGECSPIVSAALGSLSGAFAAACTTPLDVVKTRLMTSPESYTGIIQSFTKITNEEGVSALFRGIEPRVMWIGIGGFVFFGAYEEARKVIVAMTK